MGCSSASMFYVMLHQCAHDSLCRYTLVYTHAAASLLQAAGNASGQVAKHEHDIQLLLKLERAYASVSSGTAAGQQVSFNQVKQIVMRSQPPNTAALPGMYNFVLKFSGGAGSNMLMDLAHFVKALKPSTKRLDSQVSLSRTCCICALTR